MNDDCGYIESDDTLNELIETLRARSDCFIVAWGSIGPSGEMDSIAIEDGTLMDRSELREQLRCKHDAERRSLSEDE